MERASLAVSAVADSLAAERARARESAEHVGHVELSRRVVAFADQWDTHRDRTVHLLCRLADTLDTVADSFGDCEARAASALEASSALGRHSVRDA